MTQEMTQDEREEVELALMASGVSRNYAVRMAKEFTCRQIDRILGNRPMSKPPERDKFRPIIVEPLDNGFFAVSIGGYVVRACRTYESALELAKELVTKPVSNPPRIY